MVFVSCSHGYGITVSTSTFIPGHTICGMRIGRMMRYASRSHSGRGELVLTMMHRYIQTAQKHRIDSTGLPHPPLISMPSILPPKNEHYLQLPPRTLGYRVSTILTDRCQDRLEAPLSLFFRSDSIRCWQTSLSNFAQFIIHTFT